MFIYEIFFKIDLEFFFATGCYDAWKERGVSEASLDDLVALRVYESGHVERRNIDVAVSGTL